MFENEALLHKARKLHQKTDKALLRLYDSVPENLTDKVFNQFHFDIPEEKVPHLIMPKLNIHPFRSFFIFTLPLLFGIAAFILIPAIFGKPHLHVQYDQCSYIGTYQLNEDYSKITNQGGQGGSDLRIHDSNTPELRFYFYKVKQGETVYSIAKSLKMDVDTLISLNSMINVQSLVGGQRIIVPNREGVLYNINQNDTLSSISKRFKIDSKEILYANDLESEDLSEISVLFLPGAKLSEYDKAKIMGYLFYKPVRGRYVSGFGIRTDPFTGGPAFHNGIDISAPSGTAVFSSKEGTVTFAGWQGGYGQCVIIRHQFGFETVYAHLSSINVKVNQYVKASEMIGRVGSTGRSTGAHLHFEVRKYGKASNPLAQVGLTVSGKWF